MSAHRPVSEAEFLWLDSSLSLADVGQRLGISDDAVSKRAKRRGLPQRSRGGSARRSVPVNFAEMWRAGVATPDLARLCGSGPDFPTRTAKRLGLASRPVGRGFKAISLADYLQQQLAARLAASAAETRAVMRLSEMVDSSQCGQWHKQKRAA